MERAYLCDILAKECLDIHQTVNRLKREIQADHLQAGPNEIRIRKLRVNLHNYEKGIELLRKINSVKAVESGYPSS